MDRDKFEDGKWYKLKDDCSGGSRCRFYKGPELVRDHIVDHYKYYEMVNFFLTDPKGFLGYAADSNQKIFDIDYVHALFDYNDNWIECLEEEK